jgi:predicted membrane-bound dolichyl-phosphate-mannose-protein mannosyltransferase
MGLARRVSRLLREPWVPSALLGVVCVLALFARVAWLSEPCSDPCSGKTAHALIFDEEYYVNAARRIDGIKVPAKQSYAGNPAGEDANSEHPQLAKLIIAGAIDLFGDGPFAWRIGSVVFGMVAILGMWWLALAAGAGRWTALLAATLMAADNLMIVHSRIGTLDIYVVTFMILAAAAYLRGHPLAAGVLLGLGSTAKLVAPYLLLVLALFELARHRRAVLRAAGVPLVMLTAAGTGVYLGVLAIFDRIAPPYDPQTGTTIRAGPIAHTQHMMSYAAGQTSPHGPTGIASYPWAWLIDLKPILYLNVTVSTGRSSTSTVHFLGFVSPPILLFAVPSVVLGAIALWRRGEVLGGIAAAWFIGTWVPFAALSLFWLRTSYLYYMVIVMPGVYLGVARLFTSPRMPRPATAVFVLLVLAAAVLTYPFLAVPANI